MNTINMINCIVFERTGKIEEIAIEHSKIIDTNFNSLIDSIFNNSMSDVKEVATYNINSHMYKIYGCDDEYLLKENKHEFPAPYDTTIFYGNLLAIKYECTISHSNDHKHLPMDMLSDDDFIK